MDSDCRLEMKWRRRRSCVCGFIKSFIKFAMVVLALRGGLALRGSASEFGLSVVSRNLDFLYIIWGRKSWP